MNSATTELAIPSQDDLYQMTAAAGRRAVIRNVDWAFYEQLVDSIPPDAHIHVDYDGKDLEIISPSPVRDDARSLLGQFAEAVAQVGTDGSYYAVESSGFLRITAEEVRRWVVDENSDDQGRGLSGSALGPR